MTRLLLDSLLEKFPDTPKKRAKQWIVAGRVTVNGVVVRRPNQSVGAQDAVALLGRQATTLDCGSAGLVIHPRVTLLHLDAALAVVNKGPGLLAVPGGEAELSALSILADFLAGRLRTAYAIPPAYRRLQPWPVHRLDQYTSGVFCLAMNTVARHHLIDQLKAHTMQREYVAYVEGRPPAAKGTWRNWLKLSDDEMRQWVVPAKQAEALEAITHYEVIEEFARAGVTKIRLRLETGRKHQIRAQAAHAGLPLVGDRTYHPRYREDASRAPHIEFDRQALHAAVLGLEHPDQPGRRLSWTATLPRDLAQLEAGLRFSWRS